MRRITLQIVAILTLAVTAAMVDGSVRGMHMPPKVTQTGLADKLNKSQSAPHAASAPAGITTPPAGVSPNPEAEPAESHGGGMSAAELSQALELGVVITADARRLDQYQAGHIPGAYFLPFEAFSEPTPPMFLDAVPTSQTVVVYCDGGECHASHSVGSMLSEMGYTDVRIFELGYPEWVKAGLPVEKGDPAL